jgi:hypothetical protein
LVLGGWVKHFLILAVPLDVIYGVSKAFLDFPGLALQFYQVSKLKKFLALQLT